MHIQTSTPFRNVDGPALPRRLLTDRTYLKYDYQPVPGPLAMGRVSNAPSIRPEIMFQTDTIIDSSRIDKTLPNA